LMNKSIEILKQTEDFSSKNLENIFTEWINNNQLSFGKVLNPMRLLLAGECKGPHIFDILEELGKEESIRRIETGIKNI